MKKDPGDCDALAGSNRGRGLFFHPSNLAKKPPGFLARRLLGFWNLKFGIFYFTPAFSLCCRTNSRRRILPICVLGSSSRNSISRGIL